MIKNYSLKRFKKYVLLFIILLSNTLVYSQGKKTIHVGLSEGVYSQESIFRYGSAYSKTDIQVGMQFELESSIINAYGIYQLFGNINNEEFSNYLFASHFLGAGVEQRVNKTKIISLIIGANVLTEIASNFKNGFMKYGYPAYPVIGRESTFYDSTPFAASVYIGADLRIYKSLHLNFSLENNFRILKTRSGTLEIEDFENRTLEEVINEQELEAEVVDQLGLRIGLSYNFSYKKSSNKVTN